MDFPRYWPFKQGIHRSPVNSLHKGQWRGAFMFSLRIDGWVDTREAGDLRRHHAHYDVIVIGVFWELKSEQNTQIISVVIISILYYGRPRYIESLEFYHYS